MALALGDAGALAGCVSMALDLAADIGDFEFSDRLVASLPSGAVVVPKFLRIKLAINLSHLALARGRLHDAERELAAVGDIAALKQDLDTSAGLLRPMRCWPTPARQRAGAAGAAPRMRHRQPARHRAIGRQPGRAA